MTEAVEFQSHVTRVGTTKFSMSVEYVDGTLITSGTSIAPRHIEMSHGELTTRNTAPLSRNSGTSEYNRLCVGGGDNAIATNHVRAPNVQTVANISNENPNSRSRHPVNVRT